jgi:hypothetical protein
LGLSYLGAITSAINVASFSARLEMTDIYLFDPVSFLILWLWELGRFFVNF